MSAPAGKPTSTPCTALLVARPSVERTDLQPDTHQTDLRKWSDHGVQWIALAPSSTTSCDRRVVVVAARVRFLDLVVDRGGDAVIQQGQVFKLKARCADGEPLWAHRYRVAGRGSARLQAGGFSSRAEAQRALHNKLARLLPGARSATLTLAEWVEEFLDTHPGERVTVAKLRWLLGKATAELGEVRLAELSPEQVGAWRLTVPEGHRFEATQALRQVLNRAVAWKLIDENPAKHGVPNPRRRGREQRPFDSWAQIRSVTERLGPMFGPRVIFAAATGLRPSELFALEQGDVDRGAGIVQVRRAYANGRVKQTKTRLSRRAVPLQAIALEALDQLPRRD